MSEEANSKENEKNSENKNEKSKETKTGGKAEEFGFQAEMEQLLHLIIHSLYTHKEIFLRELVSNASDALNKIRFLALTEKGFLDEGADLKIDIAFDEKKNEITIKDNGIGMTHDELRQNLGTIARSGTLSYIKKIQEEKDEKKKSDLIGQFGVGFYSVFMVADEVVVKSRSYLANESAYEWSSTGSGKFTIAPSDKADRGTEILIKLNKENKEYAADSRIQSIIQRYSNFVEFPIFVGENQVNKSLALWRKQSSSVTKDERLEFYRFISHDNGEPMGHIHVNAEAPIAYSSILFVPSKNQFDVFQRPDEFHVHLYVKKVFIQSDCKDLLPSYLRFVRGVVDSEDLDLNVSREVTQHSPIIAKIKKALVSRLLKMIEKWAEKEPEKYMDFYKNFGNIMKEGVESDYENKDRLVDLLRFHSTHDSEGWVSLAEYKERMGEEQKEIYYMAGRQMETMLQNPNLEVFKEKNIEVLLLDDAIDDYLMPVIRQYKEINLVDAEKAEMKMEGDKKEEIDSTIAESFLGRMKTILGEKAEDVKRSDRLKSSPCTLVTPQHAMGVHMEQMMKSMNPEFSGSKKILEINLSHPLIKALAERFQKDPDSKDLANAVNTLWEASLLRDGRLEEPTALVDHIFQYMESSLTAGGAA